MTRITELEKRLDKLEHKDSRVKINVYIIDENGNATLDGEIVKPEDRPTGPDVIVINVDTVAANS